MNGDILVTFDEPGDHQEQSLLGHLFLSLQAVATGFAGCLLAIIGTGNPMQVHTSDVYR